MSHKIKPPRQEDNNSHNSILIPPLGASPKEEKKNSEPCRRHDKWTCHHSILDTYPPQIFLPAEKTKSATKDFYPDRAAIIRQKLESVGRLAEGGWKTVRTRIRERVVDEGEG